MSRMGTMKSKSTSKAAKKRIELMAAIDTLSSHLETTFLALSSAFAQREISGLGAAKDNYHYPRKEKAHMIFVVGPSVGAAKAKVALVFDGLEVKLAGQRDDTAQVWDSVSEEEEEEGSAASDSSEEEEEEDTESTASEGSALDDSTSSGEDGRDPEQEEAPPPPPSPSPSPAPSRPTTPLPLSQPTRTTKPSPLTIHSDPRSPPSSPSSSSSSFPNPHPSLASKPTPHQNQNQKPSPLSTLSTPLLPVHGPHKSHLTLPSHSSHSHASHQLQTADRLLSRTLATFCAEDEEGGMSCELGTSSQLLGVEGVLTNTIGCGGGMRLDAMR